MKKISVFLALVFVAVLLVGCGPDASKGNDTGDKAASQGTVTGDKAPSGKAIRMGILVPFTGEMAGFGKPWADAIKVATKEINDNGGILGRQIELLSEDTKSNVEESIKATKKLITSDNVISINGPVSDDMLASMDYARQKQVLLISPAAGTTKLDTASGNFIYRTVASDSFLGASAAEFLWKQGFKEASVLSQNDEGRITESAEFVKVFKSLGGKIIDQAEFNPGQTTYQAELKKIFSKNPPVMYLAASQETGSTILKEWYQRKYGGNWMLTGDMGVQEFIDMTGAQVLEGMWTQTPEISGDPALYDKWKANYKTVAGDDPGWGSENAYDAQILLALAAVAANNPEPTGSLINDNIKKVAAPPGTVVRSYAEGVAELKKGNDINYEGISGTLDFDQYGNVPGSYSILVVKNGKWEAVK